MASCSKKHYCEKLYENKENKLLKAVKAVMWTHVFKQNEDALINIMI